MSVRSLGDVIPTTLCSSTGSPLRKRSIVIRWTISSAVSWDTWSSISDGIQKWPKLLRGWTCREFPPLAGWDMLRPLWVKSNRHAGPSLWAEGLSDVPLGHRSQELPIQMFLVRPLHHLQLSSWLGDARPLRITQESPSFWWAPGWLIGALGPDPSLLCSWHHWVHCHRCIRVSIHVSCPHSSPL